MYCVQKRTSFEIVYIVAIHVWSFQFEVLLFCYSVIASNIKGQTSSQYIILRFLRWFVQQHRHKRPLMLTGVLQRTNAYFLPFLKFSHGRQWQRARNLCKYHRVDLAWLSKRLPLQWRHNGRDGVSNHQRLDCLFNRLFRRRSKKTSKLHVTGLCEGHSLVTGEFPSQRASNAKMLIWWCHREWRTANHNVFQGEDHNIQWRYIVINPTSPFVVE